METSPGQGVWRREEEDLGGRSEGAGFESGTMKRREIQWVARHCMAGRDARLRAVCEFRVYSHVIHIRRKMDEDEEEKPTGYYVCTIDRQVNQSTPHNGYDERSIPRSRRACCRI